MVRIFPKSLERTARAIVSPGRIFHGRRLNAFALEVFGQRSAADQLDRAGRKALNSLSAERTAEVLDRLAYFHGEPICREGIRRLGSLAELARLVGGKSFWRLSAEDRQVALERELPVDHCGWSIGARNDRLPAAPLLNRFFENGSAPARRVDLPALAASGGGQVLINGSHSLANYLLEITADGMIRLYHNSPDQGRAGVNFTSRVSKQPFFEARNCAIAPTDILSVGSRIFFPYFQNWRHGFPKPLFMTQEKYWVDVIRTMALICHPR